MSEAQLPVPAFYQAYVRLAGDGNIVNLLSENKAEVTRFFTGLPDENLLNRYEKNKWTVKEVFQHVTDTERIMAYRALRISRGDKTPLAGFEQEDYVLSLRIDHLSKDDMIAEWTAVREATIFLFKHMHPFLMTFEGTANNNRVNVALLGKIIVGHTRHHLNIIHERYKL